MPKIEFTLTDDEAKKVDLEAARYGFTRLTYAQYLVLMAIKGYPRKAVVRTGGPGHTTPEFPRAVGEPQGE